MLGKLKHSNGVLPLVFHGVEILIAIFLAAMVGLTFLNVVLRFVFSAGLAWSEEVARLCFIYLVYLGSIVAARDNAHLMVDALIMKVPPNAKKILYFLIQLVIIGIMALLAYGSWQWAMMSRADSWIVTGYPVFFVNITGAVLGVVYIMICIANLIRLIVGKKDPIALISPHSEHTETDKTARGE